MHIISHILRDAMETDLQLDLIEAQLKARNNQKPLFLDNFDKVFVGVEKGSLVHKSRLFNQGLESALVGLKKRQIDKMIYFPRLGLY